MNKRWTAHQAGREKEYWYRSAYVTHDCPMIDGLQYWYVPPTHRVTARQWTCILCKEEMPKDIRVAWAILAMHTIKGHPPKNR
jgi:hypothetical protein